MSAADTQEVKNFLLHSDQQFRQLAEQHHQLDDRLHQLIEKHYLSETEQVEEVTLKKRKLALKDQMEVAARNDARYVWDNNAINLYITDGICGGICSFSFESDNIIILGGCSSGDEVVQLHEIGHYFSLFHTQGSICGSCGTGPGQCNTPGDDGIFDTLPDLACWGQDEIAVNGLSTPYASLDPLDQAYVDNTFFNIMSYHGNRSRLTYGQLERWSDSASLARRGVTSGRTWFVDDAVCIFQTGLSQCTFFDTGGPFASLEAAVNASNPAGGDIVTLRGVTPAERLTISKPLTLRAAFHPATVGCLP